MNTKRITTPIKDEVKRKLTYEEDDIFAESNQLRRNALGRIKKRIEKVKRVATEEEINDIAGLGGERLKEFMQELSYLDEYAATTMDIICLFELQIDDKGRKRKLRLDLNSPKEYNTKRTKMAELQVPVGEGLTRKCLNCPKLLMNKSVWARCEECQFKIRKYWIGREHEVEDLTQEKEYIDLTQEGYEGQGKEEY